MIEIVQLAHSNGEGFSVDAIYATLDSRQVICYLEKIGYVGTFKREKPNGSQENES